MTRLATLHVSESGDPSQSLLLSLEGVLRSYGRRVAPDELAVLLGDAFLPTLAAGAEVSQRWNVYGRHAFLEPAARMYGLELRDLHPPDAAPLPLTPPEFEDHFIDSYLPLIRTALAHDHAALAWMGWPPPHAAIWGVITGVDPATGRCAGRTIFSPGGMVELGAAPVQVYTAQDYREANPTPSEIVGAALDVAAAMFGNRLPAKYRVVTGVTALEAWRSAFRESGDIALHQRLAMTTIRARETAVRFFRAHQQGASAVEAGVVDGYIELLTKQMNLLALSMQDPVASLEKVIALEQRAAELGAIRR